MHMVKCTQVQVNYRPIPQLTNDIPAFCPAKDGYKEQEECYVDAISFSIKNTTEYLKPNVKGAEVMWKINGHW